MDWNAVFEDEGNEDGDFDNRIYTKGSRASLLSKFFDTSSYTPFIALVFTINYLLGVGCLGIPRAFLASGLVLGVVLVCLTSFFSYVTTLFIANGACRVMQTRELQRGNAFRDPVQIHTPDRLQALDGDVKGVRGRGGLQWKELLFPLQELEVIQGTLSTKYYGSTNSSASSVSPPSTSSSEEDMPEVIEIVAELLNPSWVAIYQASLLFLTSTGLLAYTQVFVSAFLTQIWPDVPLILPTALFGAVVVPLSCLDLHEQIKTQVVMSALRFVSIAMMVVGMMVIWLLSSRNHTHDHQWWIKRDNLVDMDNAGLMFSTALFAQLFQHSVPGIIRPLASTKKRRVPDIFLSALLTTGCIYIMLGFLSLVSLGNEIEQSINLNFVGFTWGVDKNSPLYHIAEGASLLVVLFPAFDTISIFPLIANTLGNNLQAFAKVSPSSGSGVGNATEGRGDGGRIFYRLVASVPPILCSLVLRDLTTALQMAGVSGVIVALVVPGLIQIKATQRALLLPPLYQDSAYSTFTSRLKWLPWAVLCFALVALSVVLYQFVSS